MNDPIDHNISPIVYTLHHTTTTSLYEYEYE